MTYNQIIRRIREGRPPDLATIHERLTANGKTEADLIRDAFTDPPAWSGQPCERCHSGRIKVLNTEHVGSTRIQRLGCNHCKYRPPRNKVIRYDP
jgi:hypothetical protein